MANQKVKEENRKVSLHVTIKKKDKDAFSKLCEQKGTYPSEVISTFVSKAVNGDFEISNNE